MKPTLRTKAQIAGILQKHEAGAEYAGLCCKHGCRRACSTLGRKYSGMAANAKRLKALLGLSELRA